MSGRVPSAAGERSSWVRMASTMWASAAFRAFSGSRSRRAVRICRCPVRMRPTSPSPRQEVPGACLLLGAGGPDAYPHHNPRMTLDESVFHMGAALYANCAAEWLAKHSR